MFICCHQGTGSIFRHLYSWKISTLKALTSGKSQIYLFGTKTVQLFIRTSDAQNARWRCSILRGILNNRYYYWMEEKDELMPLPEAEYEYMERKVVKVSSDYHIHFDNSYYSVDKTYLHRQVIVAATAGKHITSMEGQLLAEWPRAQYHGQWYTNPQHLPANLNEMAEWNSAYFIRKAMTIGPNTTEVIKQVLKCRPTTCVRAFSASPPVTANRRWKCVVKGLWNSKR